MSDLKLDSKKNFSQESLLKKLYEYVAGMDRRKSSILEKKEMSPERAKELQSWFKSFFSPPASSGFKGLQGGACSAFAQLFQKCFDIGLRSKRLGQDDKEIMRNDLTWLSQTLAELVDWSPAENQFNPNIEILLLLLAQIQLPQLFFDSEHKSQKQSFDPRHVTGVDSKEIGYVNKFSSITCIKKPELEKFIKNLKEGEHLYLTAIHKDSSDAHVVTIRKEGGKYIFFDSNFECLFKVAMNEDELVKMVFGQFKVEASLTTFLSVWKGSEQAGTKPSATLGENFCGVDDNGHSVLDLAAAAINSNIYIAPQIFMQMFEKGGSGLVTMKTVHGETLLTLAIAIDDAGLVDKALSSGASPCVMLDHEYPKRLLTFIREHKLTGITLNLKELFFLIQMGRKDFSGVKLNLDPIDGFSVNDIDFSDIIVDKKPERKETKTLSQEPKIDYAQYATLFQRMERHGILTRDNFYCFSRLSAKNKDLIFKNINSLTSWGRINQDVFDLETKNLPHSENLENFLRYVWGKWELNLDHQDYLNLGAKIAFIDILWGQQ